MDLRQQDGQEPRDQASAKVKNTDTFNQTVTHKSYIVHALNSSFFPVVRPPYLQAGLVERR